jgi:hypothetical protein
MPINNRAIQVETSEFTDRIKDAGNDLAELSYVMRDLESTLNNSKTRKAELARQKLTGRLTDEEEAALTALTAQIEALDAVRKRGAQKAKKLDALQESLGRNMVNRDRMLGDSMTGVRGALFHGMRGVQAFTGSLGNVGESLSELNTVVGSTGTQLNKSSQDLSIVFGKLADAVLRARGPFAILAAVIGAAGIAVKRYHDRLAIARDMGGGAGLSRDLQSMSTKLNVDPDQLKALSNTISESFNVSMTNNQKEIAKVSLKNQLDEKVMGKEYAEDSMASMAELKDSFTANSPTALLTKMSSATSVLAKTMGISNKMALAHIKAINQNTKELAGEENSDVQEAINEGFMEMSAGWDASGYDQETQKKLRDTATQNLSDDKVGHSGIRLQESLHDGSKGGQILQAKMEKANISADDASKLYQRKSMGAVMTPDEMKKLAMLSQMQAEADAITMEDLSKTAREKRGTAEGTDAENKLRILRDNGAKQNSGVANATNKSSVNDILSKSAAGDKSYAANKDSEKNTAALNKLVAGMGIKNSKDKDDFLKTLQNSQQEAEKIGFDKDKYNKALRTQREAILNKNGVALSGKESDSEIEAKFNEKTSTDQQESAKDSAFSAALDTNKLTSFIDNSATSGATLAGKTVQGQDFRNNTSEKTLAENELTANMTGAEQVERKLATLASGALDTFENKIMEVVEKAIDPINKAIDGLVKSFTWLKTTLDPLFTAIGELYDKNLKPVIDRFTAWFSTEGMDKLKSSFETFVNWLSSVTTKLGPIFSAVTDWGEKHILPLFKKIGNIAAALFGAAVDVGEGVAGGVTSDTGTAAIVGSFKLLGGIVDAVTNNLEILLTVYAGLKTAMLAETSARWLMAKKQQISSAIPEVTGRVRGAGSKLGKAALYAGAAYGAAHLMSSDAQADDGSEGEDNKSTIEKVIDSPVTDIALMAGPMLKNLIPGIGTTLMTALSGLGPLVLSALSGLGSFLMSTLTLAGPAIMTALGTIGTTIATALSPLLLPIAGVVAAIAAAVLLFKGWNNAAEDFKDSEEMKEKRKLLETNTPEAKAYAESISETGKAFWDGKKYVDEFGKTIEAQPSLLQKTSSALSALSLGFFDPVKIEASLSSIGTMWNSMLEFFKNIDLAKIFSDLWTSVTNYFTEAKVHLVEIFSGYSEIFTAPFKAVQAWFNGEMSFKEALEVAWQGIQGGFGKIAENLGELLTMPFRTVLNFLETGIKNLTSHLPSWLGGRDDKKEEEAKKEESKKEENKSSWFSRLLPISSAHADELPKDGKLPPAFVPPQASNLTTSDIELEKKEKEKATIEKQTKNLELAKTNEDAAQIEAEKAELERINKLKSLDDLKLQLNENEKIALEREKIEKDAKDNKDAAIKANLDKAKIEKEAAEKALEDAKNASNQPSFFASLGTFFSSLAGSAQSSIGDMVSSAKQSVNNGSLIKDIGTGIKDTTSSVGDYATKKYNQFKFNEVDAALAFQGGASIKGLSDVQTRALAANTAKTESGGRIDADNNQGYFGQYQFGAEALAESGLVDKEKLAAAKKASKGGWYKKRSSDGSMGGHEAFLRDKSNWKIQGGLDEFLKNKELQDKSFITYTNKNVAGGFRSGALSENDDAGKIAGYSKAAHLKGVGGANKLFKQGVASYDGNGKSTVTYAKQATDAMDSTVHAINERIGKGGKPEQPPSLLAKVGHALNPIKSASADEFNPGIVNTSEMSNNLVAGVNSALYKGVNDDIARGVKYKMGSRDSSSGAIDCSGFVLEQMQCVKDAINDPSQISDAMKAMKKGNTAAGITQELAKLSGKELTGKDVNAANLKEGMTIGIDNNKANNNDRYKGIDHIAQVVKDPNTGELMVSHSGSKGPTMLPVEKFLKQNAGNDMTAVDPLFNVRGKENSPITSNGNATQAISIPTQQATQQETQQAYQQLATVPMSEDDVLSVLKAILTTLRQSNGISGPASTPINSTPTAPVNNVVTTPLTDSSTTQSVVQTPPTNDVAAQTQEATTNAAQTPASNANPQAAEIVPEISENDKRIAALKAEIAAAEKSGNGLRAQADQFRKDGGSEEGAKEIAGAAELHDKKAKELKEELSRLQPSPIEAVKQGAEKSNLEITDATKQSDEKAKMQATIDAAIEKQTKARAEQVEKHGEDSTEVRMIDGDLKSLNKQKTNLADSTIIPTIQKDAENKVGEITNTTPKEHHLDGTIKGLENAAKTYKDRGMNDKASEIESQIEAMKNLRDESIERDKTPVERTAPRNPTSYGGIGGFITSPLNSSSADIGKTLASMGNSMADVGNLMTSTISDAFDFSGDDILDTIAESTTIDSNELGCDIGETMSNGSFGDTFTNMFENSTNQSDLSDMGSSDRLYSGPLAPTGGSDMMSSMSSAITPNFLGFENGGLTPSQPNSILEALTGMQGAAGIVHTNELVVPQGLVGTLQNLVAPNAASTPGYIPSSSGSTPSAISGITPGFSAPVASSGLAANSAAPANQNKTENTTNSSNTDRLLGLILAECQRQSGFLGSSAREAAAQTKQSAQTYKTGVDRLDNSRQMDINSKSDSIRMT